MNMDTQGVPVQIRTFSYILSALLLLACLSVQASQGSQGVQRLPFLLIGAPLLNTQPLTLEPHEQRWLNSRKVIRVGITVGDHEPIDITRDGNRYQGISADYLSLIERQLATPMEVLGFPDREQGVAALLAGEIDLLTNASALENEIAGLTLTRPYIPEQSVVVGRGVDTSLWSSLKGKRIALVEGYADTRVVGRLYPDSSVVLVPTLDSAMEAVAQGDVDAFIGSDTVVRFYSASRPFLGVKVRFPSALPPTGIAFAVRSGDATLRALLDRSLDALGPSAQRDVLKRWSVGLDGDLTGQRIRLSAAEQRWVRRHPQVFIASTLHPPYIYQDESGKWAGLNIDVLDRISRMTGLTFVHQAMPSTQAALETLETGRADMNTTLAETPERRQFLNFSYAYGGATWVYVVRANEDSPLSLAELSGQVLAMPARHALLEFIETRHPDIRLRIVSTYAEARRLVETGEAKATIQNEAGARSASPGNLQVGRSVEGMWSPDRFVVVKAQPELLSIMNKALDEFPVAQMRSIRMKWLGAIPPQLPLWQRIPLWGYAGAVIALLAAGVSIYWRHRFRVHTRLNQRVEEQLADQLAFKRALLDGIPSPVYVRDLQGCLIACNRHYEESMGISFEQMSGRRLIDVDLIPRQSAEQMHADCMTLLRTHQRVSTNCVLTLPGRRLEVLQWMVPFYRANGDLQGVLGGWTPACERARVERTRSTLPCGNAGS